MSSGTNNIAATADRSARQLLRKKKPRGATSLTLTSVAIERQNSRPCDTRSGGRPPVRETTRIGFRGGQRETTLINMSCGGAMIESSLAPNIAETILLDLGDGTLECAVRWVKDGRIGLEFTIEGRPKSKGQKLIRPRRIMGRRSAQRNLRAIDPSVSRSGAVRFLSPSGQPITGSHRWTARIGNIPAPGLLALSSAQFGLVSEAILDLSSSGIIEAKISWSSGERFQRMQ